MRRLLRPLKPWLRTHGGPLGSIVAVKTTRSEFVLTYDDGPQPGGTDKVLDVLANRGATATFFVLMTRVRAQRALLADVASAGHEIALHGPDHRPLSGMSYREVRRRTKAAKEELEEVVGVPVRWFRPPYGLQRLSTFRAIRATGLQSVLWGPSVYDSRDASLTERLDRASRGAQRGALLLCHDGYAGYADGGRSDSPPTLDRGDLANAVLDLYAERGLSARSLGDCLASGAAPVKGLWLTR